MGIKTALTHWENENANIKSAGLFKAERVLTTPQGAEVNTTTGGDVINMCANNYLGLANHPAVVQAAEDALREWGYGMSSVRFICGTQQVHKELEAKISGFLGTEDTILYSSCFDANGGLFEALLTEADAVISDELNHASIIDGVRLCKAARYRYKNNDIADLEAKLNEAASARIKLIITDGVFSMDGTIADLPAICDLAERYDAIVAVDDSHGVGVLGENGRGTHEHHGVMSRVDIITGTLGKALGGASGGYTSGRKPVIDLLRQRSRPYLFSNTLAPVITAASIKAVDLLTESNGLIKRLRENTAFFREGLTSAGFDIKPGIHPIVPIMLYDERAAQDMAAHLLERGVYAVGFFYPVVPKGKARVRTQVSAAHTKEQLEYVVRTLRAIK
jgi:glycine C-acetyltransferase